MSIVTIMWQNPYCTATALSSFEIVYIWIVIVYCFLFEMLITLLLIYWLFIVLFTGVVLESELIVWSLVGLGISGEYCGEESVSTLFIGETIRNQNCEEDYLQRVSISSFWCVMELFRIKNYLIGEGKLLFGQNNFLSSPLSVKSSWLSNHVFPELGRPFRKWANLLVIYHGNLLVFVI